MEKSKVNRREFVGSIVGSVGLAAAGVATGTPLQNLTRSLPASEKMAPYAKTGPLTDWSIDDMTGAAPRYAEPIGHPRFHSFEIADASPLDGLFLV
jgi:hypothetical protein